MVEGITITGDEQFFLSTALYYQHLARYKYLSDAERTGFVGGAVPMQKSS